MQVAGFANKNGGTRSVASAIYQLISITPNGHDGAWPSIYARVTAQIFDQREELIII